MAIRCNRRVGVRKRWRSFDPEKTGGEHEHEEAVKDTSCEPPLPRIAIIGLTMRNCVGDHGGAMLVRASVGVLCYPMSTAPASDLGKEAPHIAWLQLASCASVTCLAHRLLAPEPLSLACRAMDQCRRAHKMAGPRRSTALIRCACMPEMKDCRFINNTAQHAGGAFAVQLHNLVESSALTVVWKSVWACM